MGSVFVHSSVEGHLGCFRVFVVNSAAVTIRLCVSFRIIFLSSYMPGVGLLDHTASLIFVFFEENPQSLLQLIFLATV